MPTGSLQVSGIVVSIHIAKRAGVPMQSVEEAELVAGKGIVGDRYYAGVGTFSPAVPDPDHEVTLIELEQIQCFNQETRSSFAAGEFRRNIVVHGISLNELAGCEFTLGSVHLRGIRLCEPCEYLARITHREILPRLVHGAGLRAGIVRGGRLRVGAEVSARSAQVAPST